jgi:hypothetical protein
MSLPCFASLDTPLGYDTDAEYRVHMRAFFGMAVEPMRAAWTEADDDTLDELLFDDTGVVARLDALWDRTHAVPFFRDAYLDAAGRFLSVDPKVGLTLLCSYDFFRWAYPAWRDFLDAGAAWTAACDSAQGLRAKLDATRR